MHTQSALAREFSGTFLEDPYGHCSGSMASSALIPEVKEEEQRLRGGRHFVPVDELPDGELTVEEKLIETSHKPSARIVPNNLDELLHDLLALGPDQLVQIISRAREEKSGDPKDPVPQAILNRIPPVVHILLQEGIYSIQQFRMNRMERDGGPTCYEAIQNLAKDSGAAAAALMLLKRADQSQR